MKTLDYRTASTFALIALCAAAEAQETSSDSQKIAFDIDAPSLTQALMQFTEQSGLQLMVPIEDTANMPAPKLVGTYTPVAALEQLLSGTTWKYEFVNSRAISVRTADASSEGRASLGSSADGQENAKHGPEAALSAASIRHGNASGDLTAGEASTNSGAATDDKSRGIAEILVRGSRTLNIDVVRSENDVQPYTVFDSKEIERSGAANVEEFLKRQLTMNAAARTNSQLNAALEGTTSSINLRGLGANETLILVNGRRAAGVSIRGLTNQPDINGIPIAAIERIEVLPTSGSAIYGGAALGGVVNIVMKKDFDGGDISYSFEDPTSGNAPMRTVSGSYGSSFAGGRTQVLLGGQYSDGSPLRLGDRPALLRRGIETILHNSPSYLYSGSNPFQGATPNIAATSTFSITAPGCFVGGVLNPSKCFVQPDLVLKNGIPLGSPITSVPQGASPGADLSDGFLANAGAYNLDLSAGTGTYGLQSYFGTVPRTSSVFGTIRQSMFDHLQLFVDVSNNNNEGRTITNPFAGSMFSVPATAPTNPFLQAVTLSVPSRIEVPQKTKSKTLSATVGAIAHFTRGWSSELDFTWSENAFFFEFGSADINALGAALSDGTINPFVDTLAYPIDLRPYVAPTRYSGRSTLHNAALRASGPIGSLPAGSPTLTVGVDRRKESTHDANYVREFPLSPADNLHQIFFGQEQSISSIYAETLIPIVSASNARRGIHSLDIQAAGRSEHYSVSARTAYAYLQPVSLQASNPPQGLKEDIEYTSTNPTLGVRYRPTAGLMLRASYAEAFLPPTFSQLLPNPTPSCGPSPCRLIADPAIGESYLVNATGGGNPNLRPQTSQSWNVGLVWEPTQNALDGLRVNIEYYNIRQPNYIALPTVQQIVSDPRFADRVTRDQTTGRIISVDASPVNASEYKTAGWDLKVDYRLPTRFGIFGMSTMGSFIKYDLRQFEVGSPFLEYAGFPNDGGEAKIKANAILDWEYQRWSAAWTANYISSYWQTGSPGSPFTLRQPGAVSNVLAAQGNHAVPSQIYHDIYAGYDFGYGHSKIGRLFSGATIQVGIRNVFDSRPPFDANSAYYYSYFGDPRLRTYRVSVRFVF